MGPRPRRSREDSRPRLLGRVPGRTRERPVSALLRSLAEQFSAVNQARPNGTSAAPNGRSGELADVGRLQTLGARGDLEGARLPPTQGGKAWPAVPGVGAEASFSFFVVVEPETFRLFDQLHLPWRPV